MTVIILVIIGTALGLMLGTIVGIVIGHSLEVHKIVERDIADIVAESVPQENWRKVKVILRGVPLQEVKPGADGVHSFPIGLDSQHRTTRQVRGKNV